MRSTIIKALSLFSLMAISLPAMAAMIAPVYVNRTNQQMYPTMDSRFIHRGNQDITYTIPRNYRGDTNWQTRRTWNNERYVSSPQESNTFASILGGALVGNGIGYLTGGDRTAWTIGGGALAGLASYLNNRNIRNSRQEYEYYIHPQTTRLHSSIHTGREGKTFEMSSNNYVDAYTRSESHVIID